MQIVTLQTAASRGSLSVASCANHGRKSGDRMRSPLLARSFHQVSAVHGADACVALQFMSEVLAPVPD